MSLSICVLTRDASGSIERLLRSVAPLQAEIIVVDTGSTDGTVQVARSLGASVHVIAWQDDFASAQNQALDLATGEWVFWLNPDEEVVSPSWEDLPALLARPEALAYVVRVQEMRKADQTENLVELLLPRLFRRRPDVRFAGRLHPHFVPPLAEVALRESKEIYTSNVVVRHHAYLSVLTEDKIRWATRLLERELQDRPGQLHYLIEYGLNLLRLNDPKGHQILAEASDLVLAAAEAPTAPTPTVASLLEYLLSVSPEQSRSQLSPLQAYQLTQRWFFRSPPLVWILAQRAYQARKFKEAAELLERLVALGRTGTYDHSVAFDPEIMGPPALLNLGNCYLQLNDPDRAERAFRPLLSDPTHLAQAQQGCTMAQALRELKTPK